MYGKLANCCCKFTWESYDEKSTPHTHSWTHTDHEHHICHDVTICVPLGTSITACIMSISLIRACTCMNVCQFLGQPSLPVLIQRSPSRLDGEGVHVYRTIHSTAYLFQLQVLLLSFLSQLHFLGQDFPADFLYHLSHLVLELKPLRVRLMLLLSLHQVPRVQELIALCVLLSQAGTDIVQSVK